DSEGIILAFEPTPDFFEIAEGNEEKKRFSFLYNYIKPHKKLIIQLIIGLFIGSICQLILPFLTQAIVDIGITQNNLHFINLVLIAQLFLFLVQTSTNAMRSWLLLHITSRINISLLSNFLIKLMKLPIAFFDTKTIGDLLQRIQDNSRIQNFLSSTTLNVLFSAFNIVIFGFVLVYYNIYIFLIFLIAAILNFSWVSIFMKRRADLDYKRFDQASGNQSSTIQLLNGMAEIKLNNSEKRRRWEWETIQVKLFKLSIKSLSLSQSQDIGSSCIMQLMNILITFFTAKQVISGDFTLGMMLSVQFIIGQLNTPINNLVGFMQSFQDAKISLERLAEIHNKDNENKDNENALIELPRSKDIIFQNVSFRYGTNASPLVLNDISVIIPEGKVTAIVGASGSGKTTFLKLVLKYFDTAEGHINIGSHNLTNFNSDFWRRNIGVVMQDGFIFADTILRNITESDSNGMLDKMRLENAARIANISDFIEMLPNGYKTKIGASGINLSGGEKQRILIARAIYKNPIYLLFDEATSALDANNEKLIMNNLQQFYKDKTVVIVAHRLSTVVNADNIIVLENGRIIEQGNHEELTKLQGRYYTLIKNQLELGQ
ncbi:MAG: peptidase domain-containing ABC transporter, partial [Prevotella sp.]|nr:peptidase domain-containing ABC transporter [Prevotella sp.]